MNCKTKEMSSYQRLKWELEELAKDNKDLEHSITYLGNRVFWLVNSMMDIMMLDESNAKKSKEIAINAIKKDNEIKKAENEKK